MSDTVSARAGVHPEAFASRRTLVARRFLRNRLAVISLAVLALMFVAAYTVPPLLPYSHTDLDFDALQTPPSPTHWFGTNAIGQDLLALVLRGMQKSLLIGICVANLSPSICDSDSACSARIEN